MGVVKSDLTVLMQTAESVGLCVIPRWKCLQLLALCYVWGGANEAWVCDERLRESVLYAQRIIGIEGTRQPSAEDTLELKRLVNECGDFNRPTKPEWAKKLANEYGITLRD